MAEEGEEEVEALEGRGEGVGAGAGGLGVARANDPRIKVLHERLVGQRAVLWQEIETKMVGFGFVLVNSTVQKRLFFAI